MLGKPDNWDDSKDGECASLHVRDHASSGTRIMQSAWYPNQEELARLAAGEPVILSIWGGSHPPVAVDVPGNEKINKGKLS